MKPKTLEQYFDDLENYMFGGFAYDAFNALKREVYRLRPIDPVLGCVIAEPPAAKPGQGERYH